ncbi:MAG: hypothetical protein AB7U83_08440 [Vicinamibacterales bacterium]
MRTPLAADTTPEVEARQVEGWRRMSPAEKLAAVTALSSAAREMTLAGIRHRHPEAGEREVVLRAAIVLFGAELAVAAYPDAAAYLTT